MTLPNWDALPVRTKRSRKRLYAVLKGEYASLTAWKSLNINVKRSKIHLHNYIASVLNLDTYEELDKQVMRSTRLWYNYVKTNASGSSPTLTITVTDGTNAISGATVTIGTTEKTSGDDGKAAFTGLTYGDYKVEVEASGYEDGEETVKFRANRKNFTIALEATPATTGTVTVTCQTDYGGEMSPAQTGSVVLSTHNTFDWEDLQTEFEYIIAYGDFAAPATSCTLYTLDGQGQPVGTSIPFGSYYLYAKGTNHDNETVQYTGTLTVDGDETVTITLIPIDNEGGK